MCLHFGQSLLAEYLLVLPGANDIGQHDMTVRDSLETMKKVCVERNTFRDVILSCSYSSSSQECKL